MDLKSLSDYDVLDLSKRDKEFKDLADNIAFWSDRALCKGYIRKIEEFDIKEKWPPNNNGKRTPQERYLQLLSKVDCVKGSEKYIEDWKEICPYRSSKKGDIKTIEYFLRKGGDVNYALSGASVLGDIMLVTSLIAFRGADDFNEAIGEAAESGHIDIVKYLIEQGADIDYALEGAAKGGHIEIVKYLIEEQGATTNFNVALGEAAEGGHLDIIKYLISKGADDLNGALRKSAEGGHIELVKYLIEEQGAYDLYWTLRKSAEGGHIDIAKYLIEGTRNIYIPSNNRIDLNKALEDAVLNRHLEIVKYLISVVLENDLYSDVDLNLNKALRIASAEGDINMVNYLISQGATE